MSQRCTSHAATGAGRPRLRRRAREASKASARRNLPDGSKHLLCNAAGEGEGTGTRAEGEGARGEREGKTCAAAAPSFWHGSSLRESAALVHCAGGRKKSPLLRLTRPALVPRRSREGPGRGGARGFPFLRPWGLERFWLLPPSPSLFTRAPEQFDTGGQGRGALPVYSNRPGGEEAQGASGDGRG